MRKLLILLGLVAVFFGTNAILNSLKQPAEGTVVVVENEPVEVTPTETTTVVVVVEEEPMVPVDPEVIPEPKVEFKPLNFNGKRIAKFAKDNKGKVIPVPATLSKVYGGKKGVRIGGDFYFKGENGIYVFHAGVIIKL